MKHTTQNTLRRLALAAFLALRLAVPALALAAAPDPLPPVADAREQMSQAALAALERGDASGDPSSDEPSRETEKALPLIPGTYEGSDGSVLVVRADGECAYEATVSGTVNGKAMSGRLTFHGTVEGGEFSFTKVTFYGMDLTAIAASLGYTDASYWEQAAGIIYAGAFE